MTKKALIAMSAILTSASLPNTTAQELRRFDLENCVYGGNDIGQYYPFSLSSWACGNTDGSLYYNREGLLLFRNADGKETEVTTFDKLRGLVGDQYARILSAETPEIL